MTRNTVLLILLVSTAALIALPPALVYGLGFEAQPKVLVAAMGFLGVTHTGATGFFYGWNRGSCAVMFWLPAGLVAAAFFMFATDPPLLWLYLAAHYAWLMWHLGRQNLGVAAFALGGVTRAERFYLNALPLAATPAALALYAPVGLGEEVAVPLRVTSAGLVSALAVLALYLARGVAWRRVAALALALAFWLPTVAATDPAVALTFWAHPAQYLVMTFYVASVQGAAGSLLAVVSALALWVLLSSLGASWVGLALTYGASQVHFLVDGAVWRRA